MLHIETHTLNGELSTATVYKNTELESRDIEFSESELIEWIEANGKNEMLCESFTEYHNQTPHTLSPYEVITNELVLQYLKTL